VTAAPAEPAFAPRGDAAAIEEGPALAPKFGADGLLTCVVTDADSGEVVMLAHMNAEALARTAETAVAHYWSRSRGALWRKGETSGHEQSVVEMRIDCDQDAVWIKVRTAATGANCHTGRKSCFYRRVRLGAPLDPTTALTPAEDERRFDPAAVYAAQPKG
jgi:phosphoribosyl-AMP cyclohydrolase